MSAKRPGWLERAIDLLEHAMFPHQESEEEQESLTDVGRDRIAGVLRPFDENTFNAGFDAAIRATTPPAVLKMVKFTHPQYVRDRCEKYQQFRKADA